MRKIIIKISPIIISILVSLIGVWLNGSMANLNLAPLQWVSLYRPLGFIYIVIYAVLMLGAVDYDTNSYNIDIKSYMYVFIGIIATTSIMYFLFFLYYLQINFIYWSYGARHAFAIYNLLLNIAPLCFIMSLKDDGV